MFQHSADIIVHQSLLLRQIGKWRFAQPVQTSIGADPNALFGVLKNAQHPVIRQTILHAQLFKPQRTDPLQSLINSTDPDLSVGQYLQRSDGNIRQCRM